MRSLERVVAALRAGALRAGALRVAALPPVLGRRAAPGAWSPRCPRCLVVDDDEASRRAINY